MGGFLIPKGVKIMEIKINQKINQNTIIMLIGFSFVCISEHLNLSDGVLWAAWVVLLVSMVSVLATIVAYTVKYWKNKIHK